jgi:hypothetical protein
VGGTGGRHVADAHLADDFFPGFGIGGYVVGGEVGEAEATGFGLGAVAGEAVAIDGGGGGLREERGGREEEEGDRENAAHQHYRIGNAGLVRGFCGFERGENGVKTGVKWGVLGLKKGENGKGWRGTSSFCISEMAGFVC